MSKMNKKKKEKFFRVTDQMGAELLNSKGQIKIPSVNLSYYSLVRIVSEEKLLSNKSIVKIRPYKKKTRKIFRSGWIDTSLLTRV